MAAELTELGPHLQAGLLSLLHETEMGCLSRGGAVQELSTLLRFLRPSLPETLAAVAQAEARLDLDMDVPVLEQCEWLATLRCLPHLTAPAGPHVAERFINEVRPFLAKGSSPLACAVACSLLPQWAANLDTSSAHWIQQLRIICQNLRTVQQQAPTESGPLARGYSYAALKVSSVNAQAAVLLHWAASTSAAGEGEEERPAFIEIVVDGLVAQLAQLASDETPGDAASGRDHPSVGLAAAVGLGQLVQQLRGRKALRDTVARAMVCAVTAGARRAALDTDDESGAAAATVACLLGLAGEPWLALLACAPAESVALVDALVPLGTALASSERQPLELRAAAALLLSQFLAARSSRTMGQQLLAAALGPGSGPDPGPLSDAAISAGAMATTSASARLAALVKATEGYRREAAEACAH